MVPQPQPIYFEFGPQPVGPQPVACSRQLDCGNCADECVFYGSSRYSLRGIAPSYAAASACVLSFMRACAPHTFDGYVFSCHNV